MGVMRAAEICGHAVALFRGVPVREERPLLCAFLELLGFVACGFWIFSGGWVLGFCDGGSEGAQSVDFYFL